LGHHRRRPNRPDRRLRELHSLRPLPRLRADDHRSPDSPARAMLTPGLLGDLADHRLPRPSRPPRFPPSTRRTTSTLPAPLRTAANAAGSTSCGRGRRRRSWRRSRPSTGATTPRSPATAARSGSTWTTACRREKRAFRKGSETLLERARTGVTQDIAVWHVDRVRSVSTIVPGCTTPTPTPCGPSSSARFAVSAATPTLRSVPGIDPGAPHVPPGDVHDPPVALVGHVRGDRSGGARR
jgi:hypothetical protein